MPVSTRPPADPATLRQRLAALRRRLYLVTTFRGTSWLLTTVLGTLVVAGAMDWRWHLPGLVRAILLTGLLVATVAIVFRYLFRPLTAPSDDLSLALRIEEEYPSLNDALASTVQFLDRAEAAPDSSASLEREAVRRALARARDCDFNRVVNTRGLRWAGVSALAGCAAAVTLGLFFPALAWTALVRLAAPFGAHEWPRQTRLEIDAPRLRIGRNEAFEVTGRVRGVIPQQAQVFFRFEGFSAVEHLCDIRVDEHGVGHLSTKLEAGRVQRSFHFQVRANDAVPFEAFVEVLPPPTLVPLDSKPSPQVTLHYPSYTRLASPESLSPGSGNIDAVSGTVAVLRARADRPLSRAWIEYQPEVAEHLLASFLAPLGSPHLPGCLALWRGGQAVWGNEPAVIDEDGCTFTLAFRPSINGMYTLKFEDETGLYNQRLFELRIHPDPAPTVQLERPSPSKDILSVLPDAQLRLQVLAEDPQFGLRSVFLEYRTERQQAPQRIPLHDADTWPATLLQTWAGGTVAGVPPGTARPPRLQVRGQLSLTELHHPNGNRLVEGDTVFLQACADDFDDVCFAKSPGRSHEVELRIVGRQAFDLVLNQEQAAIQQELVRQREKEREAIRKVAQAETRLKKGEKLTAEDQAQLLQAEQTQQQIREKIGNEKEGLRADVARILETLEQNGLKKSAVRDRMSDVARELDRLAEGELQKIEPKLTTARQLADLLDEKNRAEHRIQQEARARELDQEARKSEQMAQQKEQDAGRSEQRARDSKDPAEKARHQQDARLQRERAAELKQKAQEQSAQAEKARRDAAQQPGQDQPRQALTEARKGQEEVEKTLNDLLARRLEPWTSTREIKGEAHRLLQEQKQLQAETDRLMKDETLLGKKPSELSPNEKVDLDNLKEKQQHLEERARQLLNQMDQVAQKRADKDQETARELREALDQAKKGGITQKMKEARERIEQNALNEASDHQKASVKELDRLVKNLEDRREAELDRLAKKLREKQKELENLIQEQEELRKKIKEAGKIADEGKRAQEMSRLGKKQQQLKQKADELGQELARLRAPRASQALHDAGSQMDEANEQLTRGQQQEQEQKDVLERLNEARQEVEQARKEAEEELGREQMTRVAEMIAQLQKRQESLRAEAGRIQARAQREKKWNRSLQSSLLHLRDNQKELGAETEELGKKKLEGAAVFARMAQRAAESMEQAGQRAGAMARRAPAVDQLPDAELTRLQQDALRRLTQVVAALKDAAESSSRQAAAGSGGGGGGGGSGGGKGAAGDSIPPLAQIKLLRDLQKDINERTLAFRKQHPNLKKLGDPDHAELESLRQQQQDVAELIDELMRPADEAGTVEGDKK